METKPVFFGKAPSENYQDYALTTYSFEDISLEKTDEYEKKEEPPKETPPVEEPKPVEEVKKLPVTGM